MTLKIDRAAIARNGRHRAHDQPWHHPGSATKTPHDDAEADEDEKHRATPHEWVGAGEAGEPSHSHHILSTPFSPKTAPDARCLKPR